jgi:DNA-binding transcriptional LysR family regulator
MSGPPDEGSPLTGRLRIKAPASFTNHFLGRLLNDFFLEYPKVDFELQLTNRPVDPLLEGFDFVITGLPVTYEGVEQFQLCPFKRFVYAAPSYLEKHTEPAHPNELSTHQCLLYSYLGTVRTWTFHQSGSGSVEVGVNGAFSTNDIDAMHRAAVDGLGIAVLPRYRAKASVEQGQLIQILSGFELPDFWIKVLRPADHNNPKLFRALLDHLSQGLARLTQEDGSL